MTVILELPQDLEQELMTEANRLGLAVSEYVLRLLRNRPVISHLPQNGAELVDYWRRAGLIGTRTDIVDSPEYARRLR